MRAKLKTEKRVWTNVDLLEALTSIKERGMSVLDAAKRYRISAATLHRQVKLFVLKGGKANVNQFRTDGGRPMLTIVEEEVLETTILQWRNNGFTVTAEEIKKICFEYCDANDIPNLFNEETRMASRKWYDLFMKRHPCLKIDIVKSGNANAAGGDEKSSEERKKKSTTTTT